MLAIYNQHDRLNRQVRNDLQTTSMGLGLVRLLMDAGLTKEARTTLASLENDFQGVSEASDKHCKLNRLRIAPTPHSFGPERGFPCDEPQPFDNTRSVPACPRRL